jgi:anti-anti-sigma factor
VLAAVVIVYSVPLIKPEEFRAIARVRRTEFYWAAVACLGVILLGTLKGILVAVIVSLLALAQQAHNPPVYVLGRKRGTQVFRRVSAEHADDETWPGLLVVRPEGRIFFANAERIGDKVTALIQATQPKVVVIDCRAVIDIEYTALRMLETAEEKLRHEGIVLWLTALNPSVLDVVQRSALGKALGRERMFFKLQTAVETYERSLTSPSGAAAGRA